MAFIVKPTANFLEVDYVYKHAVFLGGSIEQGTAEDWQSRVSATLDSLPVLILNPRRDDWDSTWDQDPTIGTQFSNQVNWELNGQEFCDTLVYYFHPNTKAPITLLELGLFISRSRVHVYCPKQFWRYGNVQIVCDRAGHECHTDEASFLEALIGDLR